MNSTMERIANLSPQKLALLKKVLSESEGIAEPIAVVGIGCRFAGASSINDYWRLIRESLDMTGEIPSTRWDVDAFFDPTGTVPGKMTTRWGGFLDDIDCFDAGFFGISPREAEKMDPQHRLLLQVVWEALEHGGLAPSSLRGSATGVFVGIGGVDYSRIPVQLDNYFEQITAYSGTGNALSIAANRISYTLDLRGPSLSIDTACSSSLVATHLAIRSLRSKECDSAIVGGVNAILTPETTLAFSQAQMLSPDGKCRPFDEQANGYVRGEGCGVIVLKRLSDAVAGGDMVLATIQGSAINQDGMTSGITAPRGEAQMEVIRQALRDAKREPDQVSYIEAHGTATPLGDPIELNSLAQIFRSDRSETSNPCYVGSVKANIGHTETAAGMASLIKTILMLQHRMIPRQTHFQQLNRHIDLSSSRLRVACEMNPWGTPADTLIAGVSGYGFGGANAHVILESAAAQTAKPAVPERPRHVLTLSAKTPERLREMAARFRESIDDDRGFSLPDACYTAAVGRTHFNFRAAIPSSDANELKKCLEKIASDESSKRIKQGKARTDRRLKVAFLFSGQGSQYPGMGRQLFQSHPVFRESLEECDEILADQMPERLLDVLYADHSDKPPLHQTLYTQPALFAIEYATSRLWRSLGIEPAVMIGHSIGDYVAACAAGVFSLEDGLMLVSHRARLVQSLPADGKMAVIFAERDLVEEKVASYSDSVSIAAHNGTQNVVIAGRDELVDQLLAQFEREGIKSQPLEVSHAMHSPLLEPILDQFEQHVAEISLRTPKIPLISSRDGQLLDQRVLTPSYWRDHLRHTVCFVDAVRTLQTFPLDAAIEIGPGTTLCSLAGRLWDGEPIAWCPSLRPNRDDWDVVTETMSDLYVRGVNIDWSSFDHPWPRKLQVLPTYPFETQRFWYDMSRRLTQHVSPFAIASQSAHPLIGNPLPVAGDKMVFEVTLDSLHPPFLVDHCIDQNPVMPAAAYMEQAISLAGKLFGDGNHVLRNLSIQQPLVLADKHRRVVQLQVGPDLRGERAVEIYSREIASDENASGVWTLHASATICKSSDNKGSGHDPVVDTIDRSAITSRMSGSIDGKPFYERIAECGLHYGPAFQLISELKTGNGESLARLEVPEAIHHQLDGYTLHPAILDGCLQSIAGVVFDPNDNQLPDLILPTHAEQVCVYRKVTPGVLWAHTRLVGSQSQTDTYHSDIDLFDDEGHPVARIVGARVQRISKQRQSRSQKDEDLLYRIGWHRESLPDVKTPPIHHQRRWLVLCDQDDVVSRLADRLSESGDDVVIVRRASAFGPLKDVRTDNYVRYELNPLNLSDYEQLLVALGERSSAPISVVDFWGTESDDSQSEGALAEEICSHALLLFRSLATSRSVKVARANLVTRGANTVLENDAVSPSQTSLWGFGRTAMVEMPHVPCRLVDLDPEAPTLSSIDAITSELIQPDVDDSTGAGEDHVAFRGDNRFIARLERVNQLGTSNERGPRKTRVPSGRFSLRVGTGNSLEELRYEIIGAKELGAHDVEIEVKSTGLNFSDVLKALGLYPGIQDEIVPLGIECAGVVSRVGSSVTRFQPGQRVMGVAPYSFASHTTTPEYAIVATPDLVTDAEAATIPITFLTAHHALCTLARLRKGERVLIHAGAGGVGQAAIQIAQAIGAEIFATAGSEQKREFLRSLGVRHVMDSRSLDFADQILDITSGQGVDVVLNSLPGDAITKSLSVLAAYGRFLEIGKTDIYQNRRIGLWPFQDNLSYFAIDLDRMLRQKPDEIRELYDQLVPHFEEGTYRPLPLTEFAADSVTEAFRYMAQRKNIGKVVVSRANHPTPSDDDVGGSSPLSKEATVLITGGLGAIGQQVATWAIDQGAKHLAILTRRDPATLRQEIESLQSSGASIAVIQGDVSDRQSLDTALHQIPATYPPIQSVFHAAGVLNDGLMQTMDLNQLHRAMAPKTLGAWNLHQSLTGPLDLFVMFSSVAGTIGSPGQANYAAGNAFLDGLAAHRQRNGQSAISIAWGPWDSEGMAARPEIQRQLSERGMSPIAPTTAINLLDQAIRSPVSSVAVMNVRWDALLAKLPGRGSSLLTSFQSIDPSTAKEQVRGARDESLRKRLQAADPEQRLADLQQIIADSLSDVMGIDAASIDVDQPLATLGLDSLMGMELRSGLESRLGVEIPVASLFDQPSVTSLAKVVVESLTSEQDNDASERAATVESPAKSVPKRSHGRRSNLVTLGGSDSTEPPLFCVHPVGGDLRCYGDFAKAVRSRPVYGLRPKGIQAGSQAHATMEAMISDYVDSVRQAYPEGRYCLMGWSTGGIFAYEMARRLKEQGEVVHSIMMVDTPLPSVFQNVDLNDDAKFLVDLVEFTNYFAGTKMDISYEALRAQSEQETLSGMLRMVVDHGVLPSGTTQEHLARLINVCKQHVEILQSYRPPRIDVVVHLLRPEDTSMLSKATGQVLDDDLGWGSVLPVQTHHVPGHHFTMMTGSNAASIAQEIETLILEPASANAATSPPDSRQRAGVNRQT